MFADRVGLSVATVYRIKDTARGHLDILRGRQHPGSRLPFADLASRYETSMGVVREALQPAAR